MEEIIYTGATDATNYVSLEYFHVNSCGRQSVHGKPYALIRENGRMDYHILYNLTGKITAISGGKSYILSPGDGILYKPFERQEYRFDGSTQTDSFWVHFSGTGAKQILEKLELMDKTTFRLCESTWVEELFQMMVREYQLKPFQHEVMSNGLLLTILSYIARDARADEKPDPYSAVMPAMYEIHDHPEKETTVEELAKLCHMSKARFAQLFRLASGSSPHRLRTELRIRRAEHLLKYSDLNVSEVASETGFPDPLYFSRIFKKYTSLPPKEYRKRYQSRPLK